MNNAFVHANGIVHMYTSSIVCTMAQLVSFYGCSRSIHLLVLYYVGVLDLLHQILVLTSSVGKCYNKFIIFDRDASRGEELEVIKFQ